MRVVGYIVGILLILIALPPVLIGIGAIAVGSGFDVPLEGMTAPPKAVAIVSPEFTLKSADLPSQVRDASVTLRVTPTDGSAPLFIGLAASEDVKRYLRNAPVAHPELQKDATGKDQPPDPQSVVLGDGIAVDLVVEPGKRKKVAPPAEKDFWIRQADTSTGAITVSIPDLDGKDVRLVIVRTDGKAEIAADAVATVNVPLLNTKL